MKLLFCIACIGMVVSSSYGQKNLNNYQALKSGFKNLPTSSRPKVYWWWLNGSTDTIRLKQELLSIKKAGLGGVDIFEIGVLPENNPGNMIPAGPAFMSKESLKAIKFTLDEAAKLDLEVGLNLASSWNAGGSWVEPKHAAKTVYYSKVPAKGSHPQKIKLPFPTITPDKQGNPRLIPYAADGKPVYHEEIVVLAIPAGKKIDLDTTMIINISIFFDADTEVLDWNVPAGEWDIYRYVCSNSGEQLIRPSPNSIGPILDHFDSAATRMHLMYFINRLKPLVVAFNKSALKYLYLASYEAKDFAWTPSLPAEFKKINGYDMFKFLPAIFNPYLFNKETTTNFNHDFAETFSELMINNHYRKAKEICNSYGLKIISEAGGPGHLHHIPVETLKALGSLDIPRGEFWYNRVFYDKDSMVDMLWLVKEIAAASHIYKRRVVEEEAFTSYWDWQEGPSDLKIIADRAFCEGMNRLVIHGFTHNPTGTGYPGIAYYAGTHYNDKRVWWPMIRPFNDYLSRISYILQKTDFVADVLYYYGDKIPNLVPPKNTLFSVGPGYDYEMINTEILLNDLTVENGELVLPGVSRYRVLYTGEEDEISPAALNKLKSLAEQGAIIVGKKPIKAIGLNRQPEADKAVEKLANKLWMTPSGNNFTEKGKIYSGLMPVKVLEALGVSPDFSYAGQQADQRHTALDYIHYKSKDNDFYMLRNTTDQWISRYCFFRQQNKIPEIWDPVSGKIITVSIYNQHEKQVQIPITLPPYGSYFVVFTKGTSSSHYTHVTPSGQYPPRLEYVQKGIHFLDTGIFELKKSTGSEQIKNDTQILPLTGEWQLAFPENWGAPDTAIFSELISWAKAEDKGIQYFSGTAAYHKIFEFKNTNLSKDESVYLDLGDLAEVAEVWLNNKSLGITWTKPHRVDVTGLIKNGKNALKVKVANTWSNRLTGDAITGEKFTNTNITKANKNLVPWDHLSLKKSGLLGPVTIQIVKSVH